MTTHDTTRTEPRGESGFVQANGLRHHFLSYGDGDRTVVIVPGITSPAITWEFVAERLADLARVVVLDLRGRGLSDVPAHGYALPDYAADVAGVIDALGLERPVLLGHSLGARIVAALGALHPESCGPMILADPPLTGPGRDPYPTTRESFEQQLHEAYAGTTADEVRRFYPRWPEAELQLRAEWLPTCDESAVMATYRNFELEDFFAYWTRLGGPLLFVHGSVSPVVTAAGAAEVAAANPAAQTVAIADAGHMIPWENLEDFVTVCRRFIAAAE
ncbi:alpha/beta fold hydrolase [Capillimicrobium parvum]|uniref:N-formylmaleamate deformylase n=1 Tax=Capillimicrobium parvum TaxID=2884022 RepID=A0A9E6XWU4_9ACTN|nr:alpha/beta hydrolase [Capillimicrobium parvum]UGS35919.1 N-formylmaleamate deformylase [Capillimicrobium parvum]